MRFPIAIAAGALMASAAPNAAAAPQLFQPKTFDHIASIFEAADRDDNEYLTRAEFDALMMNTVDRDSVAKYRGDLRQTQQPRMDMMFARYDRDRDGRISATEFENVAIKPRMTAVSATTAPGAMTNPDASTSWSPDYMTATYFLQINRVDADMLQGKEIKNLKGETVGTLDRIVESQDGNRYYAMINLPGTPLYQPTNMERDRVGVPLDDVLLADAGASLLLSTRGEEFLRDADAREIEVERTVDQLYTI